MKDVKSIAQKLQREIEFVEFLNKVKTGETVSSDSPDTPPWFQEGMLYQISEVTFTYFAETSILRWMDANFFAAAKLANRCNSSGRLTVSSLVGSCLRPSRFDFANCPKRRIGRTHRLWLDYVTPRTS